MTALTVGHRTLASVPIHSPSAFVTVISSGSGAVLVGAVQAKLLGLKTWLRVLQGLSPKRAGNIEPKFGAVIAFPQ